METNKDLMFLRSVLPTHYMVEHRDHGAHCHSETGIKERIDAEDNEHWGYIYEAIKQHFGSRMKEIYHQVNFLHKKFTIYFEETKEDKE